MKNSLILLISLILFSITLNSCHTKSINDTWHVTKLKLGSNDHESEAIYSDAFLSFYENEFASFFNKNEHNKGMSPLYRTGQWKKTGETLSLTLHGTMIDVKFLIVELTEKWLVLEIKEGPKGTIGTQLKCQRSELYRNSTFDLLSQENNRWRIKPAHKENASEIQHRVAGHVRFLVNYFDMVDKKTQTYFEPAALQTPFRFFSNGIGLATDFEIDNAWVSNFYDEEDASAGAKILAQGLKSMDEYPGDGKNYVKGYYNALQMILEHIEK
ncbi:MAG TPA: hypothetical protein VGQ59_10155 [Cyclobacteriaceae bacterium]|jgi:hypothetical protein|nr:hypothetical protein [Cyclobacteriaceae bacterium]